MCGRFAMNDDLNEVITEYVLSGGAPEEWAASYNIAPTNKAPIVRAWVDEGQEPHRELTLATWGFEPGWLKPGRPRPINARLETAPTNGMFRSAFLSQRCIIPMLGYYEWTELKEKGKRVKQPHFIRSYEGDVLHAAGLYTSRRGDETGEWESTFTILTREGRDAAGEVHDRMPVILDLDTRQAWLDGRTENTTAQLLELTASSDALASTLISFEVSREVNNVRTADRSLPGLIEPIRP